MQPWLELQLQMKLNLVKFVGYVEFMFLVVARRHLQISCVCFYSELETLWSSKNKAFSLMSFLVNGKRGRDGSASTFLFFLLSGFRPPQ